MVSNVNVMKNINGTTQDIEMSHYLSDKGLRSNNRFCDIGLEVKDMDVVVRRDPDDGLITRPSFVASA